MLVPPGRCSCETVEEAPQSLAQAITLVIMDRKTNV